MNDWKKDPRLKKMDPKKIEVLMEFSERLERTPGPQMLSTLLSFQAEARKKGIVFTNEETEILAGILTAGLPPSEMRKLSVLKMFSQKAASKNN